jgi:glycosyltransferase involved in cell wall biosynthesis
MPRAIRGTNQCRIDRAAWIGRHNRDRRPFECRKAKLHAVIVPCYNEMATLQRCIASVISIAKDTLTLEIIIVDDCSTDDSLATATALAARHSMVRVVQHKKNTVKGAAIRSGISEATGNFVAIQDADLEYDPKDLLRLVEPLVAGKADVVIGSRFLAFGGTEFSTSGTQWETNFLPCFLTC